MGRLAGGWILGALRVSAQTLECKAEAPLGFRFCAEKFTGGCVN